MPVDGSSKKTIGGLPSIAIATDSLRLLPPESVPAHLSSYCFRSISIIFLSTSSALLFAGIPLIEAYSSRCSRTVRFSSSASNYGQ